VHDWQETPVVLEYLDCLLEICVPRSFDRKQFCKALTLLQHDDLVYYLFTF